MPVIPTEVSLVSDGFGYGFRHMVLVLAEPPPQIRRLSVAPDTGEPISPWNTLLLVQRGCYHIVEASASPSQFTKMSFGFSIGDIITVAQRSISIYEDSLPSLVARRKNFDSSDRKFRISQMLYYNYGTIWKILTPFWCWQGRIELTRPAPSCLVSM